MRPRTALITITLLAVAIVPAWAEDLAQASETLCEKVKACALAQLGEEDITPETRQMMQPMLDTLCANIRSQVSQVPADHPHYAPALACTRSIEALSCDEMMITERLETPACEEYRALAQEGDADA